MATTDTIAHRTIPALLLFAAPSLCIFAVNGLAQRAWLAPGDVVWGFLAVLVMFSPLPFALPALMLQDHRDRYEPGRQGMLRGMRMLFALSGRGSACLVQMWAGHLGLLAAGLVAVGLLR